MPALTFEQKNAIRTFARNGFKVLDSPNITRRKGSPVFLHNALAGRLIAVKANGEITTKVMSMAGSAPTATLRKTIERPDFHVPAAWIEA